MMAKFFSKSRDRHQTTDPRTSKNSNKVNMKKPTYTHIIFQLQETKDQEKILKIARGKNTPFLQGTRLSIIAKFLLEIMQARRQ